VKSKHKCSDIHIAEEEKAEQPGFWESTMGFVSQSANVGLPNRTQMVRPSAFTRVYNLASIPAKYIGISLLPLLSPSVALADSPAMSDHAISWTSIAVSSAVTGIGLLGQKAFSSKPIIRDLFKRGVLPLGLGGVLGSTVAGIISSNPASAQTFETYFPAMAVGGLAIAGIGAFSLFLRLHSKMLPFTKRFLIPTSLILTAALSMVKFDLPSIDQHETGSQEVVAQQTPSTWPQHTTGQPEPNTPRTSVSFLAPTDALIRIVENNDGTYGDDAERAMCVESSSNLYFIYLDKAIERGCYREAYSNLVRLFNSTTPSGTSFRDLIEAGAKNNNNIWGAANYYSYRARVAELLAVNSDNEADKAKYFGESAEYYSFAQQCVFNFLGSQVRLGSITDVSARLSAIDSLIAANPGSDAERILTLAFAGWAGSRANSIASSSINLDDASISSLRDALSQLRELTQLEIGGENIYTMPKTTPFLFSNVYGYTGNAMVRLVQEEMPDNSGLSNSQRTAFLEKLGQAESQYILPAIRHPYSYYGNAYNVQLNADQICGLDDRYTFNMTRTLASKIHASGNTGGLKDFYTLLYWRQNDLAQAYATRAFVTGNPADAKLFDELHAQLVPGSPTELIFTGLMGKASWENLW